MPPLASVLVNGRTYAAPQVPTVVICMDGSAPAYTEEAMAAGCMPYLTKALASGMNARGHCVIPSFTNPNNLSIMTGATPAVHGISGNYYIDPHSGQAVMMNEPELLRADTIFAAFSRLGVPVAIVTAKDKLRRLLSCGLQNGVCFSAEKADRTTRAEHGISEVLEVMGEPVPEVYSADLTGFTLRAGVKLLEGSFPGLARPQLMYLSTTDYIQHKHAPGSPAANSFYGMLDRNLEALDRLGATWVLTADHGMSAKADAQGEPRGIFLQSLLDELLGPGCARVILPITDPYVVHHGALGSYASIYVHDSSLVPSIVEALKKIPEFEWVGSKEAACQAFSLPPDRIGEIIAISDAHSVIGTRREEHDLSALKEPLRSHGGLGEREVPLLSNRKASTSVASLGQLHNYDAWHLALNLLPST